MKPEDMLKKAQRYLKALEEAKRKHVAVGLPKDKVGGKVYGDGMTVMRVGAIHEFGLGNNPERSFLRMPFDVKRADISSRITTEFKAIFSKGRSVDKALSNVGITARSVSIQAFRTGGYGQWSPLSDYTVKKKGSSKILIDTGILRGSITWEVR